MGVSSSVKRGSVLPYFMEEKSLLTRAVEPWYGHYAVVVQRPVGRRQNQHTRAPRGVTARFDTPLDVEGHYAGTPSAGRPQCRPGQPPRACRRRRPPTRRRSRRSPPHRFSPARPARRRIRRRPASFRSGPRRPRSTLLRSEFECVSHDTQAAARHAIPIAPRSKRARLSVRNVFLISR